MAKRPPTAKKTLSAANLTALGPDRLAAMLIAVAAGDANWKRRLKLELAAEAGASDLALEIDRRLAFLAGSRARISWRKRPELMNDLRVHMRMIVDRLTPLDARLGLDRLIAWFDLHAGLCGRVKDPKGEVTALFFDASADLAVVASAAGPDVAVPILFEALQTRLSDWGGWVGRAAPDLSLPVAAGLVTRLTQGRPRPTGRLALVVRKLADRAGDAQAWIDAISDEDRVKPEVGAEMARRLVRAGRPGEARAALDAARPRPPGPTRWSRRGAESLAEVSEAWQDAEILVLEAEGRGPEAQAARWAAFARTLSEPTLRAFLSGLPDFEDVEAIDQAHALAAAWPDAGKGLSFLMARAALREAAAMIIARPGELRPSPEDNDLWASRLAARYPVAALVLVRARAVALARQGLGDSDEVRALASEAATLAGDADSIGDLSSHAVFIDDLEALSRPARRSRWR